MSSHILNNSHDEDSTISLENLFQCATTFTVIKVFTCVEVEINVLVLSLAITKKSLAPSSLLSPIKY